MCGSRKYPCPLHGWSLEIPRGRGRGVSKASIFKEKSEAKLVHVCPEGWVWVGGGFKPKNHCIILTCSKLMSD